MSSDNEQSPNSASHLLYREKVLRARQMTLDERLLEGCRLRDLELETLYREVASSMPDAATAEIGMKLEN